MTTRPINILKNTIFTVFSAISGLAISFVIYISATYPEAKIEEIIYQLRAPTGEISLIFVIPILCWFLVPFLVLTLFTFTIKIKFNKTWQISWNILLLAITCSTLTYFIRRLDVIAYITAKQTESEFILTNYVDPKSVKISFPQNKRNLIYIILESMEVSYFDKLHGGYFNHNLIPELLDISVKNESFSQVPDSPNGAYSPYGTTWTMGAIFAQQSGLPLISPVTNNSMATQKNFFDSIVTLNDILYQSGYNNAVARGSDAFFAGSEIFYKKHGNASIFDYKYAKTHNLIPMDYRVWWGFEDRKLFNFSKNFLLELAAKNKPFNLTIITADTHFPDGYIDGECNLKYIDDQYGNSISCSSKQIYEFLEWIQGQQLFENTTIVLAGDHPTMDGVYSSRINDNYKRKTYFAIVNGKKTSRKANRSFTTFDLFPTVLASIGAEIEGDRLGLGVNLYSDKPTLLETFDNNLNKLNEQLKAHSSFLESKAEIPKIKSLDTEKDIKAYLDSIDNKSRASVEKLYMLDIEKFFEGLKELSQNTRFGIFISLRERREPYAIKPEAITALNEATNRLGLRSNINTEKISYISYFREGKIVEIFNPKEEVKQLIKINNHEIFLLSSITANSAYINIDGVEYSESHPGLNIVVYDFASDKIIYH